MKKNKMNSLKKLLAVVLFIFILIQFSACGKKDSAKGRSA